MNRGFTLVETIILLVIVGVMMTLAFPHFIRALDFQRQTAETLRLAEIKASLEAYAKDNTVLPDESDWVSSVATYSTMSANDIAIDSWTFPRIYRKETETRMFEDTQVTVEYAIVYSHGSDGNYGNTSTAVAGTDLLPNGVFNEVSDFADITAAAGDQLIKVSTYLHQLAAYELTLMRLQRFAAALGAYADRKYHAQVTAYSNDGDDSTGEQTARAQIFYPPSESGGNYNAVVRNETLVGIGSSQIVVGNRTHMENLARMLGLSQSDCCSALSRDSGGNYQPFFYYSNPRQRLSNGSCPQPGNGSLPARVRLTFDSCGQ